MQFQSLSDGGFYSIVLYFTFSEAKDADNAFKSFCAELDKGCFKKDAWGEGKIEYKSDDIRINIFNTHPDSGNSVSVHVSRK